MPVAREAYGAATAATLSTLPKQTRFQTGSKSEPRTRTSDPKSIRLEVGR
jgi:hypothetical protein